MASDDPTLPYPHPHVMPEPHFIPGYTGYCPQEKYNFGKSYPRATNELLLTYYDNIPPRLDVIHPFPEPKVALSIVQNRHPPVGDVKLRDDLIPGYTGYIPTRYQLYGKRYRTECIDAIANFEANQIKPTPPDPRPTSDEFRSSPFPLKCTRLDPPMSWSDPLGLPPGSYNRGQPVPEVATGWTPHDAPEGYQPTGILSEGRLDPVWPESIPNADYLTEKPYFMSNADVRKYFIPGYAAYVPRLRFTRGMTYSTATNFALRRFTTDNTRLRTLSKRPITVDWLEPPQYPTEEPPFHKELPNHVLPFLDTGIMPNYGGYVPGYKYVCGDTYGAATLKLGKLSRATTRRLL